MVQLVSGAWLHLLGLAAMVAMVAFSRRSASLQTSRRADQERRRFTAALVAELSVLRELHQDNLKLIADRAGHVFSARQLFGAYRVSLGRIQLFSEQEIVALVAANAAQERLEAILAVHGTATNANLAWRTPADDSRLAEIRQAVVNASRAVQEALTALDSDAPACRARQYGAAAAIRSWVRQQRGLSTALPKANRVNSDFSYETGLVVRD
jgi:hypothetical protein